MTSIDAAGMSEVGVAVARKALDQVEAEGAAVNSMIQAAKDVQEQSQQQAVKNGRLDVYG